MGIYAVRKINDTGGNGSRGITLPKAWLSYLGDVKTVTIIGSDLLVIAPPGLEAKARRLVSLMESQETTTDKINQYRNRRN